MQGKIIKNISNDYTVSSGGKDYVCKPRGKFRFDHVCPLVGDEVVFNAENQYLLEILPRTNELVRPSIANIDQAFVLASVREPDLDLYLLDKLLVIIEYNRIQPIICFTKLDKLSEIEKKKIDTIRYYYEKIGYPVYYNDEVEDIKACFKDAITVFTGQSGAGKSTLLNKLNIDLNLKTDEISLALGRGKHTTRHVELLPIASGLIADTPGFSNVDFGKMSNSDIRDNMVEFNTYREFCEYQDCMHVKETTCAIKEKVTEGEILESRYENYLKFISKG